MPRTSKAKPTLTRRVGSSSASKRRAGEKKKAAASLDQLGSPSKRYPSQVPAAKPVTGFPDPVGGRPVTDLVVFGATGDLMRRLLMPSLLKLTEDRALPKGSTVLGVGPRWADAPSSDDDFRARMRAAAEQFGGVARDSDGLAQLTQTMGFQAANFSRDDLAGVKARLETQDAARAAPAQRLLYLALPPQVLPEAIKALKQAGMLDLMPGRPPVRLILEKPFGHDLQSAQELRDLLRDSLTDPKGEVRWQERVLLIDHYMGKPAVAELVDLRFGKPTHDEPWNGAFESMFNAQFIDRVEIQAEEEVDIGSAHRGAFMEAVGAFRDMFQSHLQQVASLLVMDRPGQDAGAFDRAQTRALLHFHSLTPDEVRDHVVRGQYTEGRIGEREVDSYRHVEGVAPNSNVETFFAVRTQVDDPKWNGVPFFIWSGKALEEKETSVRVDFKGLSDRVLALLRQTAPQLASQVGAQTPASLLIGVDPSPSFTLRVAGESVVLKPPESFDPRLPHQRLLEDAMEAKTDLFVSPEEALAQWEHAEAVLDAWANQPSGPVFYSAGSLPQAAAEYMDDDDDR